MTIKKNNRNVVLVTPENIHSYIPKNKISSKIWKLDLIAQRSDYFRYLLIHHNGGLWLDFDTICLKNLDSVIAKLENYELAFQSEQFFAGRKGVFEDVILDIEQKIAKKMTKKYLYKIYLKNFLNTYLNFSYMEEKLQVKPFEWTEIGIDCVRKHIHKYNVHYIEQSTWKTKMKYSWEPQTNVLMFSENITTENFLNKEQLLVKLFNHMYDKEKKESLDDNKNNLFNKIVAIALEGE